MQARRHALNLALLKGVVAGVRPRAADRPWIEVSTPHFTVVADDARSARNIAWQFEQIREAIKIVWPWARTDLARPVIIFAARDEGSMRALVPSYWELGGDVRPGSVFAQGADRYYIAVRADLKADDSVTVNPYISANWSYVTMVLAASQPRDLPPWFSLGLAWMMANTQVQSTGLALGRPIPWQLGLLKQPVQRLTIAEMLAIDRTSPTFTRSDQLEYFDALSWAFVHCMMFGDNGVRRPTFDRVTALLLDSRQPASSAVTVFGNVDELEKAFREYVRRPAFEYVKLQTPFALKAEGLEAKPMPAARSAAMRSPCIRGPAVRPRRAQAQTPREPRIRSRRARSRPTDS